MKNILVASLLVLFIAGCTPTMYIKKVTVEKDSQGKIQRTVIEESVTQPNRSEMPIDLKYVEEGDTK